jgi:hypothetical protein
MLKAHQRLLSYFVMFACNRQGLRENGTSLDIHQQLPAASFDWTHPHGPRCFFFVVPDLRAVALSEIRVTTRWGHILLPQRALVWKYSLRLHSRFHRLQTNCLPLRALKYRPISGCLSNKFYKLPNILLRSRCRNVSSLWSVSRWF